MSFSSEILADSPAGYYRLDGTVGRTVDSSGNSRALTASGSNFTDRASLVPSDASDGSCEFDNETATGVLSTADTVFERTGTGAFTLAFVCKLNTIDTTYRRLVSWTVDTGASSWFGVQYQSSAGFLGLRTNAGSVVGPNGTPSVFDTNTAYHVWLEYTGSNIELWVNDVQMGSTTADTASIASFPGDWRIGAGQFGSSSAKAIIDEVAFYSSALGATRRAAHYAAFASTQSILFPHRVM